jgi:nitrate/TMAO reductase-like tetraheme cytochrome c subunit
MKKIILLIAIFISASAMLLISCAPTKEISEKSGAQLWGENCNRCHNAPSQDQYSKEQWSVIGNHMKLKAGITYDEMTKIVAYLKGEM